jgi:hypothetical protein
VTKRIHPGSSAFRGLLRNLWLFSILLIHLALAAHAGTVWNGPLLVYRQPTADPTQASNQDRLTPDVWLTRASSKGLFNAFYETNATALSPTNTEWTFGALTNYASLSYTNWLAWLNGQSPTNLVGRHTVLHLISDNIYLSVQFTNWAAGGSGGFAYQRSTPDPASISGINASDQTLHFSYSTSPGYTYVVQSSTDLVTWASFATNLAGGSLSLFTNAPGSFGENGYYRVEQTAGP